jgi:ubiquinone/menaquinone biosynthesis C-methylase UbiE
MSSPSSSAREQFGRQAHRYARSRPHAQGTSLEALVRLATPSPSDRALDVATGAGFAAFALAEAAGRVVASDLTRPMLEQARSLAAERRLANLRFVQTSAEDLPFADASFDVVSCRVAPHHFVSVPRFLASARRLLRTGGRVVVADTTTPEDADLDRWQQDLERLRDPSHVRNYSPSEWRRLFSGAGLHVDALEDHHRTELLVSDWVRTSGSPPHVVAEVTRRFATAPSAVRAAFAVRDVGGDVHFSWPVVVLRGRPV